MSRLEKQPVILKEKVQASLEKDSIHIEGPKGKLSLRLPPFVEVKIEKEKIWVERKGGGKKTKGLRGTIRALIDNMVKGVVEGYKKELEIVGVGYKAQMKGKELVLQMGFSHPVNISVPDDLKVSLASPTKIVVEGIDKQKVGEFCAQIRKIYPPEPYKGKGIRYAGEVIRRKLGKAMAK